MSEFMDEAKNLASEHSDVADKGVQEAGQFAEGKTGGQFDSEIQGAEQQAEGFLGGDNQGGSNQGGGQDQQSGNY